MEGTIITSNVVESYVWTRMADLPAGRVAARARRACSGGSPATCRSTAATAGDFLRTFFRRYEGASVEGVQRLIDEHVGEFMLQKASAGRDPADPRAPRGRAPHDPDHRGGRDLRPAARAAVRHRDRRRARGARRPLHRLHVGAAARRRGPRRVAAPLRAAGGHRPEAVVRVRGLATPTCRCCARWATPSPCRPTPRCYRYAQAAPVADRGVGDVARACRGSASRSRRSDDDATADDDLMALALELFRSRRAISPRAPSGARAPGPDRGTARAAPPGHANAIPQPPGDGWARVQAARSPGSAAATSRRSPGKSSFYFSPLVSLPFVPGHEVVGELLDDCDDLAAGTRVVVLSSVLACAARGEDPVCANCAAGDFGRCDRVTVGDLQGGTADRLLRRHRRRMEPHDARRTARSCTRSRRT